MRCKTLPNSIASFVDRLTLLLQLGNNRSVRSDHAELSDLDRAWRYRRGNRNLVVSDWRSFSHVNFACAGCGRNDESAER